MAGSVDKAKRQYFPRYPEVGSEKVSLHYYQKSFFERERSVIFPRVWLNAGKRGRDIAQAGDFFVLPLPFLNTSLLFCRGEDGAVRAFHNVCSHRGNLVAYDECGNTKRFICRFHNWTFDTQGRLVGAPGAATGIPNFDRKDYGLTPVHVELWNDFIFFSLSPPATSLQAYLGEWGESLSGYPFDKLGLVAHYRAEIKANWKVVLNAFQEAYHGGFLHSRSQPDGTEADNPLSLALDITLHAQHARLSVPGNQVAIVLARDPSRPVRRGLSPTTLKMVGFGRETVRDEFSPKHFPRGVNPTRAPNWAFDINVVYPNWWIAIRGDHAHTYNFWPVTHDTTVYDVRIYYPPAATVKETLSQEVRRIRVRNTLPEDLSTVEGTQAALNSGARDHLILTDEEILIAHHHYITDQYLKRLESTGT